MFCVDNAAFGEGFNVHSAKTEKIQMYAPFFEGAIKIREDAFWEVT